MKRGEEEEGEVGEEGDKEEGEVGVQEEGEEEEGKGRSKKRDQASSIVGTSKLN